LGGEFRVHEEHFAFFAFGDDTFVVVDGLEVDVFDAADFEVFVHEDVVVFGVFEVGEGFAEEVGFILFVVESVLEFVLDDVLGEDVGLGSVEDGSEVLDCVEVVVIWEVIEVFVWDEVVVVVWNEVWVVDVVVVIRDEVVVIWDDEVIVIRDEVVVIRDEVIIVIVILIWDEILWYGNGII